MVARRRLGFFFLLGAAALIAAGAAGVAWQLQRARDLVRQSLERRQGVQVSVGRVRLAWPPGHVVVEEVAARVKPDGSPFLSLPRLSLVLDLFSIARGSLAFSQATALSPSLNLSLDRDEKLSALLGLIGVPPREREAARPSVRTAPAVVLPSALSVVEGRLLFSDRSGATRELQGIGGRLTRKGGGLHVEIAQPELGRLLADISPAGPGETGELFMAGERLPLEVLSGLVIPGQPAVGGRATYTTRLRWRGLSWPEFRQSLAGAGALRVEDGWFPAMVRAEGGGRPLRYRELAVRFRVAAGRAVTDELEIRGRPWTLRGSGRLDPGGKLTAEVASPPGQLPALQGRLDGDLSNPRLTILRGNF
jgi:hypothetical protein